MHYSIDKDIVLINPNVATYILKKTVLGDLRILTDRR